MAKFYGPIGYAILQETTPGVWTEVITEHTSIGDLVKNTRSLETANQVNDNINMANNVSIISDAFAVDNFSTMRYVVLNGTKWKIKGVEVAYPRLVLTVGDVYNG